MKANIHNTALVPYLIAEKVTDNIRIQELLINKAERVYTNNETWRNQLHKSNDQRQFLKMFMDHWMNKLSKIKNN
jgi:hypothetical protein